MPLHWYFTSALPRALLGALPLAALGMALERRLRSKLACVLMYIAAYSLLPHKEVRYFFGSDKKTMMHKSCCFVPLGLHLFVPVQCLLLSRMHQETCLHPQP